MAHPGFFAFMEDNMPDQLELADPAVQPAPEEKPPEELTPPPPPPSPEEEVQRLREENARLLGENTVLKERPKPAEQPPPPPTNTLDSIEGIERAFGAGEITDTQRTRLIARVEVREESERRDIETRQTDAVSKTRTKMGAYLDKYPALRDRTSPLLQRVSDELREMAELGLDPQDIRIQLQAVEKVITAAGKPRVDPEEFNRRKIPTGGGGMGGPEPPAPKKDETRGKVLYERLTVDAQDYWKDYHKGKGTPEQIMVAVYKTMEHADESRLRRGGFLAK